MKNKVKSFMKTQTSNYKTDKKTGYSNKIESIGQSDGNSKGTRSSVKSSRK